MRCKVCSSMAVKAFDAKILKKYNVCFYKCTNCGFLSPDEIFWLNESYTEAINCSDTGIFLRNNRLSKIASCIALYFFDSCKSIIDWGGGMGFS